MFGVPKYGSSIQAYIYEVPAPADGSDPAETGCNNAKFKADPNWASPFILLINRGECHFTEKVRNAAHAGAVGVIVADNVALASEPLAYCPDYTQPMYELDGTWVACETAAHGMNCKCGTDHRYVFEKDFQSLRSTFQCAIVVVIVNIDFFLPFFKKLNPNSH